MGTGCCAGVSGPILPDPLCVVSVRLTRRGRQLLQSSCAQRRDRHAHPEDAVPEPGHDAVVGKAVDGMCSLRFLGEVMNSVAGSLEKLIQLETTRAIGEQPSPFFKD